MRAVVLNSFSGPAATSVADIAEPQPGPGQVVVAVEAAAVGAWDLQTTNGAFTGMGGRADFPQVLGWDFTGTVAAVGPGVEAWQPGEAVLGFTAQPWTGAGAFAELVTVDAAGITARPSSVTVAQAAALPVSGLTADLAVTAAALSAGDTVLVLGATGGVGSLVVQLARRAGARVIASVGPDQEKRALELGADGVVDRSRPVADQVREAYGQVEAVIDLVGPAAWTDAVGAARRGGRFVTTVPAGTPSAELGLLDTTIGVQPDGPRLAELVALVGRGELTSAIGDVVPLSELPQHLLRLEQGAIAGKLVLDTTR